MKPKPSEVTRLQFARWSVEFDESTGGRDRGTTLESLPQHEQEIYLREADEYLNKSVDDWPLDILQRVDL